MDKDGYQQAGYYSQYSDGFVKNQPHYHHILASYE